MEPESAGLTVTLLCDAYWVAIQGRYSAGETRNIMMAIRIVRQLFGTTPAADVGPNAPRIVRESMIAGDKTAKPPRQSWSRGDINIQMKRIRQIYKWGTSREMLPPAAYHALATLESRKRGQSPARESTPVKPVDDKMILAIKKHVSAQVDAMINLQLVTGMRPGEVRAMRPADIDMNGHVWLYQPEEHKTVYRGKKKTVYLGPKAQGIIRPFLKNRPTTAYFFSPAETDIARRAELTRRRKTPDGVARPGR